MSSTPSFEPTEDYWLDNYGHCQLEWCMCLKFGWKGRSCVYWKPLGVKSFQELKEYNETKVRKNPK